MHPYVILTAIAALAVSSAISLAFRKEGKAALTMACASSFMASAVCLAAFWHKLAIYPNVTYGLTAAHSGIPGLLRLEIDDVSSYLGILASFMACVSAPFVWMAASTRVGRLGSGRFGLSYAAFNASMILAACSASAGLTLILLTLAGVSSYMAAFEYRKAGREAEAPAKAKDRSAAFDVTLKAAAGLCLLASFAFLGSGPLQNWRWGAETGQGPGSPAMAAALWLAALALTAAGTVSALRKPGTPEIRFVFDVTLMASLMAAFMRFYADGGQPAYVAAPLIAAGAIIAAYSSVADSGGGGIYSMFLRPFMHGTAMMAIAAGLACAELTPASYATALMALTCFCVGLAGQAVNLGSLSVAYGRRDPASLGGIYRRSPGFAALSTAMNAGATPVPILCGFIGRWFVALTLLTSIRSFPGSELAVPLAAAALCLSEARLVMGVVRTTAKAYMGVPCDAVTGSDRVPLAVYASLCAVTAASFAVAIYPQMLLGFMPLPDGMHGMALPEAYMSFTVAAAGLLCLAVAANLIYVAVGSARRKGGSDGDGPGEGHGSESGPRTAPALGAAKSLAAGARGVALGMRAMVRGLRRHSYRAVRRMAVYAGALARKKRKAAFLSALFLAAMAMAAYLAVSLM
ncbi:MAG: hypothetical protein FWE70_01160 [Oscillospiraceae bacterium]|nr:hypothetical protein [Oscillospiraceae bacterium]